VQDWLKETKIIRAFIAKDCHKGVVKFLPLGGKTVLAKIVFADKRNILLQMAKNPSQNYFSRAACDSKRHQMERDAGAVVAERFLFHGTSKHAVDAICTDNFDWRVCGSHGTVYGQGNTGKQICIAWWWWLYYQCSVAGWSTVKVATVVALLCNPWPCGDMMHDAPPVL